MGASIAPALGWIVLSALLGALCLANIWHAAGAEVRAREKAREAKAAREQADLAEAALMRLKQKRSDAVRKGNQTRAENRKARIRQTTDAVRTATRAKRAPPIERKGRRVQREVFIRVMEQK